MSDKVITELTPEQEAQLPVFRDKWIEIGLRTLENCTIDKKAAEEAIARVYAEGKDDDGNPFPPPEEIVWVDSPEAAWKEAARRLYGTAENLDSEKFNSIIQNFCYGNHDASWLAHYDVFREFGIEVCNRLKPHMDLAHNCGWWLPYDTVAICSGFPLYTRLDDDGRIHCEDGPAIYYPDGFSIYGWHGLRIDSKLIEEPITIEQIEGEQNAELRRVMIELFGFENYIKESDAEIVQEDECGVLIRRKMSGADEEDLVLVKVVNSTPEPDGTFKEYFLPVPPTTKTAREGVAWTFDMSPEEYSPKIQT